MPWPACQWADSCTTLMRAACALHPRRAAPAPGPAPLSARRQRARRQARAAPGQQRQRVRGRRPGGAAAWLGAVLRAGVAAARRARAASRLTLTHPYTHTAARTHAPGRHTRTGAGHPDHLPSCNAATQGPDAGRGLLLQYEGEFFKGQRHGQGTCQYHAAGARAATHAHMQTVPTAGCGCSCAHAADLARPAERLPGVSVRHMCMCCAAEQPLRHPPRSHPSLCRCNPAGEVYTGQWLGGRREGDGRLQYANGDSYEGAWRADRRNGPGRLRAAASGDVFVGTFAADKRQGLGVLYMTRMGECEVAGSAGKWWLKWLLYRIPSGLLRTRGFVCAAA